MACHRPGLAYGHRPRPQPPFLEDKPPAMAAGLATGLAVFRWKTYQFLRRKKLISFKENAYKRSVKKLNSFSKTAQKVSSFSKNFTVFEQNLPFLNQNFTVLGENKEKVTVFTGNSCFLSTNRPTARAFLLKMNGLQVYGPFG